MKPIEAQPNLAHQVQESILNEITSGRLRPGARVIQEQVAKQLGVSRQPVQQALHLLRNRGILRDAPGRGLEVVPLDLTYVRQMYDIRAVVEGLAAREAARKNAHLALEKAAQVVKKGKEAVKKSDYGQMIAADMEFHTIIYGLAGNPLIATTMETHWTTAQRVMGEVLRSDEEPRNIWAQHEAILQAIASGDAENSERLARSHITQAADFMLARLAENQTQMETEAS